MFREIISLFKKFLKTEEKKSQESYYKNYLEKNKVKTTRDMGMILHDYRM